MNESDCSIFPGLTILAHLVLGLVKINIITMLCAQELSLCELVWISCQIVWKLRQKQG